MSCAFLFRCVCIGFALLVYCSSAFTNPISRDIFKNDKATQNIKLRDLVDQKSKKYLERKLPLIINILLHKSDLFIRDIDKGSWSILSDTIIEYYESVSYKPIWFINGRWSMVAREYIDRINRAKYDGLFARNYDIPGFNYHFSLVTWYRQVFLGRFSEDGFFRSEKLRKIAEIDILITYNILRYVVDAYKGVVAPGTLGRDLNANKPIDLRATLLKLVNSKTPEIILESFQPQNDDFKKLKKILKNILDGQDILSRYATPLVSSKPYLRFGINDNRVLSLRKAINEPVEDGGNPRFFDKSLKKALIKFQRALKIVADGVLGPKTVRAINYILGQRKARDIIIANMERWRWLPSKLSESRVVVNVPEYVGRFYKDDELSFSERVIVGKPDHKTPIFSDKIEYLVFNPYWYVPFSIGINEIIPLIQGNPDYFKQSHMQVLKYTNGTYRIINPETVNWYQIDDFNKYRFRQLPGASNALGRIKFIFPNNYSVYLHDTPRKELFNSNLRAFSHGCVRVRDPIRFAKYLLSVQGSEIDPLSFLSDSYREKYLKLSKAVPVHIVYFTVTVDESGKINMLNDIYGYDNRVVRAVVERESSVVVVAAARSKYFKIV